MSTREKLLKQFRELVGERLKRISDSVLALESGPSPDSGRKALRELHGLKGEARMMGFQDINSLVHEMEELVRAAEPAGFALTGGSTDALLVAADAVSVLAGATEPAGAPPEVQKLVDWLKQRTQAELTLRQTAGTPPGDPSSVAPGTPVSPTTGAPTVVLGPSSAPPVTTTTAPTVPLSPPTPASGPPSNPPTPMSQAPFVSLPGVVVPGSPPTPLSQSPFSPMPGLLENPPTPLSLPPFTPAGGLANAAQGSSLTPPPQVTPFPAGPVPAAKEKTAPPQRPAGRAPDPRAEGVRIGVQSLDVLTTAVTNLTQVARRRELAAAKRLGLARELTELARLAEDLGPQAAAIASRLNRCKEVAAELHREQKLLANEELRDLSQVSEEVQALRMLPLSVLFEPYPRMVRDLARELGKEVELLIEGEATRADRTVLEALRDPLMHLVRNALDHGLEGREERVRQGKSPRGKLTLRAAREGERILIRVEDDGVGLDPAKLRRVAVRKGFLDEATAQGLSDAAARELIFLAGFSSKDAATDLSGRGVGLDVVRVHLQGLGGDVAVTSQLGMGTVFELRVPVSLTVAPLLFIQVGEEKLCLTASHVVHALKVEKDQVVQLAGRPAVRVQDEVLPFASIGSILGVSPERLPTEGELVLLLRGQGATAAISVDRVLEERVQAILPLRGMLERYTHLTGATNLADGSLAMVLSASYLISSARGVAVARVAQHPARKAVEVRKRRILVVDDSPLTRELISSLLEAVGYEIVNAADGAEAFERLGKEAVDMVVTDLEMPRVDGLELTRRLKGHPTLRSLPVVIITTRGSEADRRRGMEAGADGYIAKGDLVRQDLVDVVSRLLG